MKVFAIVDMSSLKLMGLYEAPQVDMKRMTSDRPLQHVELPEGFSDETHELDLVNDKVVVKKK